MEITEKNEQNAAGDNRQNVAEKERRVCDMACSADGAQIAKENTNKARDMASPTDGNGQVFTENADKVRNTSNLADRKGQISTETAAHSRDMACSADGAQIAKENTNKACDMASLVSENKRVLEENASSLSAPGEDRKQDFLDFITALDALNEMAEEMWKAGMNEKACLTEAQIYTSSAKILGESHPAALKAMYNYALGLAKTGRNEESAAMLNKYLEIADSLKEAENDSSIGKDGK